MCAVGKILRGVWRGLVDAVEGRRQAARIFRSSHSPSCLLQARQEKKCHRLQQYVTRFLLKVCENGARLFR